MTHRATPVGWLLLLVLVAAACSPAEQEPAAAPTADPDLVAAVTTAFATYRAGVEQGNPQAVLGVLDEASLADMARIAEVSRDADEATVRAMPAAEQLLVLTYRLRPALLEGADPFADLIESGFGGQDRSLGELGAVTAASADLALGVVVDGASQTPTPLRWRFRMEDGQWRFDLVEAHRLLSQAIRNSATRSGVGVDELVAATVVDLSGEAPPTVEALYTEIPG